MNYWKQMRIQKHFDKEFCLFFKPEEIFQPYIFSKESQESRGILKYVGMILYNGLKVKNNKFSELWEN